MVHIGFVKVKCGAPSERWQHYESLSVASTSTRMAASRSFRAKQPRRAVSETNGTRCWAMARLLKYVDPVHKKSGRVYFYFRRHGKRTPLPGAYNSPEFLEAYWALRDGRVVKVEIG